MKVFGTNILRFVLILTQFNQVKSQFITPKSYLNRVNEEKSIVEGINVASTGEVSTQIIANANNLLDGVEPRVTTIEGEIAKITAEVAKALKKLLDSDKSDIDSNLPADASVTNEELSQYSDEISNAKKGLAETEIAKYDKKVSDKATAQAERVKLLETENQEYKQRASLTLLWKSTPASDLVGRKIFYSVFVSNLICKSKVWNEEFESILSSPETIKMVSNAVKFILPETLPGEVLLKNTLAESIRAVRLDQNTCMQDEKERSLEDFANILHDHMRDNHPEFLGGYTFATACQLKELYDKHVYMAMSDENKKKVESVAQKYIDDHPFIYGITEFVPYCKDLSDHVKASEEITQAKSVEDSTMFDGTVNCHVRRIATNHVRESLKRSEYSTASLITIAIFVAFMFILTVYILCGKRNEKV